MMISVLSRRLTKQWSKFSKNHRGFSRGASSFWAILQTTYKRLIASILIERNPIIHRLTTDPESLRDFAYRYPFGQPKKSLWFDMIRGFLATFGDSRKRNTICNACTSRWRGQALPSCDRLSRVY